MVMTEENKTDVKDIKGVVAEVKSVVEDSPFIADDDLFEIVVEYYKDNKKIVVKDVAETFDENRPRSTITFKIKYPSQADCETMFVKGREGGNFMQDGEINLRSFYYMETMRLLSLVRSWSDPRELNNKSVLDLQPDIIKAVLSKIRDEIGTTGII